MPMYVSLCTIVILFSFKVDETSPSGKHENVPCCQCAVAEERENAFNDLTIFKYFQDAVSRRQTWITQFALLFFKMCNSLPFQFVSVLSN